MSMRIVALSDQHGFLPEVPPCDLLIVAGDVCPDRFGPFMAVHYPSQQQAWFDRKVRPWLAAAPATHKVLTWGNHDWCGQQCSFRADSPSHARSTDLQIVVDERTTIPPADDTRARISVWATPWSNLFGQWSFMKPPRQLEAIYAAIPEGIDILVSHQPPFSYGDQTFDFTARRIEHVGSRELLRAIERVRPRLVICGHIHGGHGRYEHQGIPIYNVSVVDEAYRLVNPPTVIEFEGC
ncbi:MAG: metallophosphoesterase [Acidobacteria bacterium]|nr:metallophosphoesterase [Acidobacteriota bacterium]